MAGRECPTSAKHLIDSLHDRDFLGRSGHQDGAVALDGLHLPAFEDPIELTIRPDHAPSQAVAGASALPEAALEVSRLRRRGLRRELSTVFSRHHPLQPLHDGRGHAAVVAEQLGAVLHTHAGLSAHELVVGALVGVLETAPPAHIIDEDRLEAAAAGQHVCQQASQTLPALDGEPAYAFVGVSGDDLASVRGGVQRDRCLLVLN